MATTTIEERAVDWLIRQRDPAFSDWEAFGDWLAADPRHAEVYHEMAAADADVADMLPPTAPPPVSVASRPAPRISRRAWVGGALAASVAALVGYATLPTASDLYAVETPAGARRVIDLEGSRIALNGGTRIRLDRNDARFAALDHGQAMFDVVHDAAHPFRVEVAGATLVDAGTAFEVTRDRDTLELAVAEGLVIYNPDGEKVRVPAGHGLSTRDADAQVVLTQVTPAQVGGWRDGRLAYDGAPLARVAADLARNLGVEVALAPSLAAQPFRGVINLEGGGDAVMARIGPLLGVAVRRSGQGWVLTART